MIAQRFPQALSQISSASAGENTLRSRTDTPPASIDTEVMNKQRIAASFSAAATTYDAMASIQKDVGLKLLAACQFRQESGFIADIGCGTGWLTDKLRRRFPQALLLGLDLAEGMINYASQHQPAVADHWWVADMEALPVAGDRVDLLYSNLAMQWLDHPLGWLQEAWRVLRPGGQLLCSTLLPGTLRELEACWAVADQSDREGTANSHVNRFLPREQLRQAALRAGFAIELKYYEDIRFYPSVRDLMAELKGIGAHNVNNQRPQSVTGKGRIRLMLEQYERFHTVEGYPATYQVALLSLTKPAR